MPCDLVNDFVSNNKYTEIGCTLPARFDAGPIPATLGDLILLAELSLANNKLSGECDTW